jgi:hypothetical protein
MKTWRNFMANGQRTVVIGLFELPDQAERALKGLKRVGFRSDQVGFALRGGGPPAGEAAGPVDAAPGEPVEGFIPGMGAITTGGPLTGILSGAAAGAMAGGLLGTLVGLGLPEAEARQAAQGFPAGQPLVLVSATGRTAEAAELLRQHGAEVRRLRARRPAAARPAALCRPTRATWNFAARLRRRAASRTAKKQ